MFLSSSPLRGLPGGGKVFLATAGRKGCKREKAREVTGLLLKPRRGGVMGSGDLGRAIRAELPTLIRRMWSNWLGMDLTQRPHM
jgi:hypothetical protein